MAIPSSGRWHVVVNMNGLRGSTQAAVRVLPGALPPAPSPASSPLASIRQAIEDFAPDAADEDGSVEKDYDVFISHAGEDKQDVAGPLADALTELGLVVWYSGFELRIGDNIRRKIDAGLVRSRFGVVVLSPNFLRKGWPNYELDGLVTRENAGGQQLILPIWHNLERDDVMRYSPSLAGRMARSTADTSVEEIAAEIADVVHGE